MKKRIFLLLLCILTISLCLFVGCKKDDGNGDKTPSGDAATEGGSGSGNGGTTDGSGSGNGGTMPEGGETPKTPSVGLEYELSDDESYYLLCGKGSCTDTDIIIPSTHLDKPVKVIDYLDGDITSITIPESITDIYEYVFYRCSKLTSITVDEKNTVFKSVDGILYSKDGKTLMSYPVAKTATSFTIPSSVETVGEAAFRACKNLTSVTIPDSVKTILNNAFKDCSGLTGVTIPNSVNTIGGGAFEKCTGLTEIIIPDSVQLIGQAAFCDCDNLERITLPFIGAKKDGSDINYIGHVFSVSSGAYFANTGVPISLKDVTITGVTSIGDEAFSGCSDIVSITIPDTVESIGDSAFSYCIGLGQIDLPDVLKTIGNESFKGCYSLTSIKIPSSVTSIGENAFAECHKLLEVISDPSLNITETSYGLTAHEVHSGESKTVNQNGYLFYKADSENYLLSYVGTETDLNLPADFNGESYAIHDYAFYEQKDIKSVTISDKVTAIGDYAFQGMPHLKTVTIGNSVKTIGNYAFASSSSIESVTISSSVTTIGKNAFISCLGLKSITIPDSVTSLGEFAFYFCDALASVTIGDGLVTIEKGTFAYCRALKTVIIGSKLKTIGQEAFENCTVLESITLPDNVTTIGEGAFRFCGSLTDITIGTGVTKISSRAFYCSDKIKNINYRGTETQWNSINKGENWDTYSENGENIKINYTLNFNYTEE